MGEDSWEIDQEVLLRDCDRINQGLNNRLNLRYQVAALFIALIAGLWTAIAAVFATTLNPTVTETSILVAFLSLLFGFTFSVILLVVWRIFTHVLITDDVDEGIALQAYQIYLKKKDPRPLGLIDLQWENRKKIAEILGDIWVLREFLLCRKPSPREIVRTCECYRQSFC
jgi:hypothetical protein